jgi:hypothetical protein
MTATAPHELPPKPEPRVEPRPKDELGAECEALMERLRAPQVSDDGALVAVSVQMDGVRVLLYRIDVATGRFITSIMDRVDDTHDVRRAHVAEANAALAEKKWEPLVECEMSDDPTTKIRAHGLGFSQPRVGVCDGLRIRFHEPLLLVDEDGGRPLARRAFPAWSNREPVAGQPCRTYAELQRAWVGRRLGVLVVEIGYSGSPHFCEFSPLLEAVGFHRMLPR